KQRVEDIADIVVTSVNNVPVRVRDLVARGSLGEGVVVGHQPRLGRVSLSRRRTDANGNVTWSDEEEKVQGVVLMRKNEATTEALKLVKEKLNELNTQPGRMPPGLKLDLHFDLTGMLHRTTETVNENLIVGMVLVTMILLMFLSNVRCALIVAINIPLA